MHFSIATFRTFTMFQPLPLESECPDLALVVVMRCVSDCFVQVRTVFYLATDFADSSLETQSHALCFIWGVYG